MGTLDGWLSHASAGAAVAPRIARWCCFPFRFLLSSWAGLFGTNWFDLIILKRYVPISGIGVYSLATQLAGVVQQITVIFRRSSFPICP